jgi:hypothetical protein
VRRCPPSPHAKSVTYSHPGDENEQARPLSALAPLQAHPTEVKSHLNAASEFIGEKSGLEVPFLIGATNEKPRLAKQPGFPLYASGHSSYQILWLPNAPAAMIFKSKTAFGDDADSPSHRPLFRFLRS